MLTTNEIHLLPLELRRSIAQLVSSEKVAVEGAIDFLEVEDVLYQHPAVREAVGGVPDDYRGETVKAFVALKDERLGKVGAEEIISFCKERLADYEYPREVELVAEIPKTASGKLLRRELRAKSENVEDD